MVPFFFFNAIVGVCVCIYVYVCIPMQVERKRVRALQLTSAVQERTQHTCSILYFGEGYYLYFRFGT